MDRLPGEVVDRRRRSDHASAAALAESVAVGRVVDVETSACTTSSPTEIPLQGAVQAWVPEIGERKADPTRELADPRDDGGAR